MRGIGSGIKVASSRQGGSGGYLEWAIAGGVAGLIADTAVHPLDTISTRQKLLPPSTYSSFSHTASEIARREGALRGLLSGVSATVLCALPATGVYFCAYEASKQAGSSLLGTHSGALPAIHLVSGAVAELASSAIHVPFEVVKTRMQLGPYHNAPWGANGKNYRSCLSGLRAIVRADGPRVSTQASKAAFYSTAPALQFAIYEEAKWTLAAHSGRDDDKLVHFASGSAAGFVAAWITNPLEVIASRLMVKDCLFRTVSADWMPLFFTVSGMKKMWRGLLARSLMMASTPLSPLQFTNT